MKIIKYNFWKNNRLGGLKSRSRQFEKRHLDSWDFLDSLKNDILTNLDNFYAIKSRFVLIFIFVSIEALDLDTSKTDISTVEKILTLQKS